MLSRPGLSALLTVLAVLVVLVLACGCGQAPGGRVEAGPVDAAALRTAAEAWVGTPHRIGGRARTGVDCSGLVLELLEPYGARLPRRAEAMRAVGVRVRGTPRAGDLAFFATRRADGLKGHVGVVLDRDSFVHATASKGVLVSSLSSPYWGPRLQEVRRVCCP